MTPDEAKALRQELEAADAVAAQLGVRLANLAEQLRHVRRQVRQVAAKAEQLPTEDCCRDLLRYLVAVEARLDAVREKAKGLST
jgi:hypothetical protein